MKAKFPETPTTPATKARRRAKIQLALPKATTKRVGKAVPKQSQEAAPEQTQDVVEASSSTQQSTNRRSEEVAPKPDSYVFPLSQLSDPPADFKPWGEKYSTCLNRLYVSDLRGLCRFYFWNLDPGFDFENKKEGNREPMLRAIWKLFYHMQPMHRPTSWIEFRDGMHRDAGPRLLDYTRLRKYTSLYPVSRYIPELPKTDVPIDPDFVRPRDAPTNWPDSWVEQAGFSATRQPSENGTNNHLPIIFKPVDVDTNVTTITTTTRKDRNSNTGKVNKTNIDLHSTNIDLAALTGGLVRSSRLSDRDARCVTESVERALIRIAYSDLERHPSAAPRTPPRFLTAASPQQIFHTTIASSSAVSHVRLRDYGGPLVLHPEGDLWVLKGRGPALSDPRFTVMDCVITLGKLLDAGSTNVDRKESNWFSKYSPVERAFVELADVNWDSCLDVTGIQAKERFRRLIERLLPDFRHDDINNAIYDLWEAVSQNLGQFELKFDERLTCCPCSPGFDTVGTFDFHHIYPPPFDTDAGGVGMQELFTRTFEPRQTLMCEQCGAENSRTVTREFSQLPLRMAVKLHPGTRIERHTGNVKFKYRATGGNTTYATYRWLGGIYCDGKTWRIYWDDAERGEVDMGHVRMYDNSTSGLIIAGPMANESDEKVPTRWWASGIQPLLIYERILNPSSDVLGVAVHTACKMLAAEQEGRMFLNEHIPWPQAVHRIQPHAGYPWHPPEVEPAADGQRFHLAPSAYIPEANQEMENLMKSFSTNYSKAVRSMSTGFNQGAQKGRASASGANFVPPLPSVDRTDEVMFTDTQESATNVTAQAYAGFPTAADPDNYLSPEDVRLYMALTAHAAQDAAGGGADAEALGSAWPTFPGMDGAAGTGRQGSTENLDVMMVDEGEFSANSSARANTGEQVILEHRTRAGQKKL